MKVALYCRLSEEDRNKLNTTEDSESIQNQKAMLIEYAMERQWGIYSIYSDDDYAGADRNRPEFQRLLKDAEARKFDIVLCKTQSRFTRELELVEKYLHHLFPLWGIRFVSIVDNADTANKGNKKSRQINGLVNEWYLEDMSENIKSVLTNRRKNGFHIGAFAPYGYQKDPQRKGHLIPDPESAKVVLEIFEMFAQGYGKTAIARILNARGIPNPTEYKRQQNLRYMQPRNPNATLWKYFTIGDILINEVYIGNLVQGRYGSVSYKTKTNKPIPKDHWIRAEGTHEGIIPHSLWSSVQELVRQKAKPFITGTVGLFARKVKCSSCGYALRSTKSRERHYLKCETSHVSRNSCIGAFIPCEFLEQYVREQLKGFYDEYLDIAEVSQKAHLTSNIERRIETLKETIAAHERKLAEYSKSLKELYLDKTRGIISESEFLELRQDFDKEKVSAEKLLMTAKEDLENLLRKQEESDNKQQIIQSYIDLPTLNREAIVSLIDYIEVGRRDPQTREYPIEIHWNF